MELAGKYAGLNSLRDSGMSIHQGIDRAMSILKNPAASEGQQMQAMIDLSELQNILVNVNKVDEAIGLDSVIKNVQNRLRLT
jgi:hypothetical protein